MKNKPSIIGVIPARYQSSRFPGKPLADIGGKSMIQRVYEQCLQSNYISDVVIATDDDRIFQHAKEIGAQVVMTQEHPNGTSRCAEAVEKVGQSANYVINIQGDEPFIQPQQIDALASTLISEEVKIASMAKKIEDEETLFNPNVVKVVMNAAKKALYFSRSTIPHIRSTDKSDWLAKGTFYKHLGLYGYRKETLFDILNLPSSQLEGLEMLEQLKWLDHGFDVHMAITEHDSIGVDTPEDIESITKLFLS